MLPDWLKDEEALGAAEQLLAESSERLEARQVAQALRLEALAGQYAEQMHRQAIDMIEEMADRGD